MAIVKRQHCGTVGWTTNYFETFFQSFNSERFSVSKSGQSVTVSLPDNIQLIFTLQGSGSREDWANFSVNNNGTSSSLSTGVWKSGTNYAYLTCALGESFIYVAGCDGANRRALVYYNNIDNNVYCCAVGTGSDYNRPFYNLSTQAIYRRTDSVSFSFGSILNYPKSLGSIDYCQGAYLLQGGALTNIIDTELISSSTVTADNMYTFEGKNYYSAGTNLLIPIDS